MRLATLQDGSRFTAGVLTPDGFARAAAAVVEALFAMPDWKTVDDRAIDSAERIEERDAVYAPVVVTPRKVLCCGHNYAEHIADLGKLAPEFPTLFARFADTPTGALEDIGTMANTVRSSAQL